VILTEKPSIHIPPPTSFSYCRAKWKTCLTLSIPYNISFAQSIVGVDNDQKSQIDNHPSLRHPSSIMSDDDIANSGRAIVRPTVVVVLYSYVFEVCSESSRRVNASQRPVWSSFAKPSPFRTIKCSCRGRTNINFSTLSRGFALCEFKAEAVGYADR
jgi:hypothetical protein